MRAVSSRGLEEEFTPEPERGARTEPGIAATPQEDPSREPPPLRGSAGYTALPQPPRRRMLRVTTWGLALLATTAIVFGGFAYIRGTTQHSGADVSRRSGGALTDPTALQGRLAPVTPAQSAPAIDAKVDAPPSGAAPTAAIPEAPRTKVEAVSIEIAKAFADVQVFGVKLGYFEEKLSNIGSQLQELLAANAKGNERMTSIESRLAALERARTAVPRTAPRTAPRSLRSHPTPQGAAPAAGRAPAETAAAADEPETVLLSVDMWNGSPSVVVKQGDQTYFLAKGERTPSGLTLKEADANEQKAMFVDRNGRALSATLRTGGN